MYRKGNSAAYSEQNQKTNGNGKSINFNSNSNSDSNANANANAKFNFNFNQKILAELMKAQTFQEKINIYKNEYIYKSGSNPTPEEISFFIFEISKSPFSNSNSNLNLQKNENLEDPVIPIIIEKAISSLSLMPLNYVASTIWSLSVLKQSINYQYSSDQINILINSIPSAKNIQAGSLFPSLILPIGINLQGNSNPQLFDKIEKFSDIYLEFIQDTVADISNIAGIFSGLALLKNKPIKLLDCISNFLLIKLKLKEENLNEVISIIYSMRELEYMNSTLIGYLHHFLIENKSKIRASHTSRLIAYIGALEPDKPILIASLADEIHSKLQKEFEDFDIDLYISLWMSLANIKDKLNPKWIDETVEVLANCGITKPNFDILKDFNESDVEDLCVATVICKCKNEKFIQKLIESITAISVRLNGKALYNISKAYYFLRKFSKDNNAYEALKRQYTLVKKELSEKEINEINKFLKS